ncbi:tRNA (adenosine(37)-N6)-threonylcarbamoyltransferase complex ATPase subunit type 1 TsaE [bacterium]|nr:tRNA (adenosine(37)-N6)-threonylcarbamoyltransferase complex ATPase subunit type 1 TsaE [bacterium]
MEQDVRWEEVRREANHAAEQTTALGAWLATQLDAGDAVALIGTLGAGKTTLVRGLVQAMGYRGRVRSPSFTLVNIYPTDPEVRHVDLYRLNESSELIALDLDEGAEEGILLVEWADRLAADWGEPNWRVTIHVDDLGEERVIVVERSIKSDAGV